MDIVIAMLLRGLSQTSWVSVSFLRVVSSKLREDSNVARTRVADIGTVLSHPTSYPASSCGSTCLLSNTEEWTIVLYTLYHAKSNQFSHVICLVTVVRSVGVNVTHGLVCSTRYHRGAGGLVLMEQMGAAISKVKKHNSPQCACLALTGG